MSKMKNINQLIDKFEQNMRTVIEICQQQQSILAELKEVYQPKEEPSVKLPEKQTITMEDVRKVLAQKATQGFKQEVKDLLKAYGADKLTQLASEHYAKVLEEAGGIGQ